MICPFSNINHAAVEILKWIYFSPNIFLCMWPRIHVEIQLIHVSKSVPRKCNNIIIKCTSLRNIRISLMIQNVGLEPLDCLMTKFIDTKNYLNNCLLIRNCTPCYISSNHFILFLNDIAHSTTLSAHSGFFHWPQYVQYLPPHRHHITNRTWPLDPQKLKTLFHYDRIFTGITAYLINYSHGFRWAILNYPRINFNGGLVQPRWRYSMNEQQLDAIVLYWSLLTHDPRAMVFLLISICWKWFQWAPSNKLDLTPIKIGQ